MPVRASIDWLRALGDDPVQLSMGEAGYEARAARAENLMERISLIGNLVPRPLLDTQ